MEHVLADETFVCLPFQYHQSLWAHMLNKSDIYRHGGTPLARLLILGGIHVSFHKKNGHLAFDLH